MIIVIIVITIMTMITIAVVVIIIIVIVVVVVVVVVVAAINLWGGRDYLLILILTLLKGRTTLLAPEAPPTHPCPHL